MARWFNTAGPCKPDIHYMLPAAARIPQARQMIEQQAYFVIHAPRQTGKTTTMMALARELTASGRMDLLLRYGDVRLAIELKTWRSGERDPLAQGLAQLDEYLAGLGLSTGWLVIFDQRPGLPPNGERTSAEELITPGGRRVTLIRG